MTDIILGIGLVVFIVYAAFNIAYIMSMKRTSDSTREFLAKTESNLNETLSEFRNTLENIRMISSNVRDVTTDVRQISHTAAGLEAAIRELLCQLKESIGSAAEANVAGLKAGITTGIATLMTNLQQVSARKEE